MTKILVMDEILDHGNGVLLPCQHYLLDHIRKGKVVVVEHSRPTDTCKEKIDLLNRESDKKDWRLEQAVKALYFSDSQGRLYGFVTPELGGRVDVKRHVGKKLCLASLVPAGMELGTCTPFLGEEHFPPNGPVQRLFVHQMPELDDLTVDLSIGGIGEYAHRVSVWASYGLMREILVARFGKERVTVEPLHSNAYKSPALEVLK